MLACDVIPRTYLTLRILSYLCRSSVIDLADFMHCIQCSALSSFTIITHFTIRLKIIDSILRLYCEMENLFSLIISFIEGFVKNFKLLSFCLS